MDTDKEYSIFLHIIEGAGFVEKTKEVTITATLNGVKFEVEGHCIQNTIIFNSNCIWECLFDDLKRMKMDNRPIKIECFHRILKNNVSVKKSIGFILLPIRNLQTVKSLRNLQIKLHWHKLSGLAAEWRQAKPEIYLSAIITTKEMMESGHLEDFLEPRPIDSSESVHVRPSETSLMLKPQKGLYVKLLEDECLLQVGNSPEDCDTFIVNLTFRSARNLERLVGPVEYSEQPVFTFHYDFLGVPSDIMLVSRRDKGYCIGEKISVNFRSSLGRLQEYFKHVFYIPVDLSCNKRVIGNFSFRCADLMPPSLSVFDNDKTWEVKDSFTLQTLFETLEPAERPSVDYVFIMSYLPMLSPTKDQWVETPPCIDKRACGDMRDYKDEFHKDLQSIPSNSGRSQNEPDPLSERQETQNNIKLTTDASVSCRLQEPQSVVDDPAYEIVAELEDWKQEQISTFLHELKRKEVAHLNLLSIEWERQKKEMVKSLQDRLDECSRLTESLEAAHAVVRAKSLKQFDLERDFERTKHELDKRYTVRFMEIEEKARRIKDEMDYELKIQELRFKDLEIRNTREIEENVRLRERVKQLEEELESVKRNTLPKEQLAGLFEDLRVQKERFVELEKSKKFYKEQWAKLTKELHKSKLQSLKIQEEKLKKCCFAGSDSIMDLKKLILEEHTALQSDRSELKSIKDAITSESDSSKTSDS